MEPRSFTCELRSESLEPPLPHGPVANPAHSASPSWSHLLTPTLVVLRCGNDFAVRMPEYVSGGLGMVKEGGGISTRHAQRYRCEGILERM